MGDANRLRRAAVVILTDIELGDANYPDPVMLAVSDMLVAVADQDWSRVDEMATELADSLMGPEK
jgi:hypothetical protein